MTLYLYKIGASAPTLTIEDVVSYTDSEIRTEDGTVYSPLTEGYELSSLPDCSETLRADWMAAHPGAQEQLRADIDFLAAMQGVSL